MANIFDGINMVQMFPQTGNVTRKYVFRSLTLCRSVGGGSDWFGPGTSGKAVLSLTGEKKTMEEWNQLNQRMM